MAVKHCCICTERKHNLGTAAQKTSLSGLGPGVMYVLLVILLFIVFKLELKTITLYTVVVRRTVTFLYSCVKGSNFKVSILNWKKVIVILLRCDNLIKSSALLQCC